MQSAPIAPDADETARTADVEVDPTNDALDADPAADVLVTDELVIEEISIDGMCGVY